MSRKARRLKIQLLTPLSPSSTTSYVQNAMLVLVLATFAIYYPLELVFVQYDNQWLRRIDISRELLFLADFLLMFNTAFTNEHGGLVTSRHEIANKYLHEWFIPDLVFSISVRLLLDSAATRGYGDPQQEVETVEEFDFGLGVERLAHVLSIAHFLWFVCLNRLECSLLTWLTYSKYSHLLHIAWIIIFVVLISHYVTCGWALLGGRNDVSALPLEEYTTSFYDVLQLLQGQGVPTATVSHNVFTSFAMLLGSIVLAIVFGHVAVLVSNFNANSTNYQRKMETVFAITSKMQLPEPLRERIHQYYDHLWREYESLDGEIERFSKNLSHTLELEVVLCKYMDLIMGIPFWVDCSPDFQKHLMLNLRVRVYLPDDYVIRRGEVDEEFYMINRGSVELATGPDSFERSIGGTRAPEDGISTSDMSDRSLPNHSNQRRSTKMAGSGDLHRPHRHDSNRSIYRVDNFVDDAPEASLQDHTSETHHSDNRCLQVLTKDKRLV